MTRRTAEVVVCGAGIAGVATAHELAVKHRLHDVVLIDERPPLTLTSDKSTEAYRNWWSGPDDAMIRLMNRSIDLLEDMAEECQNRFLMNRRGYLYGTADPRRVLSLRRVAQRASAQGSGPLRVHLGEAGEADYRPAATTGFVDQPDGADLILDADQIRRHFPYVAPETRAVLHARRCGWLSGQQLGMYMLEEAHAAGVRLIHGRVEGVAIGGGRVEAVRVATLGSTTSLSSRRFVNACGPMVKPVAALLDVDLPVYSELHVKASFRDSLGVVPRDAPLLVWDDPQRLPWNDDERDLFACSDDTGWLLDQFPSGVHLRPEGGVSGEHVLVLWPYHPEPVPEVFPLPLPPHFAEVALRGMSAMVPGLTAYFEHLPQPYVDGGYYTRTAENRPLICPLPVDGAFVVGALSGFGLMVSAAAAELVAAHVTGSALPDFAPSFALQRYEDPAYHSLLDSWGDTGQL